MKQAHLRYIEGFVYKAVLGVGQVFVLTRMKSVLKGKLLHLYKEERKEKILWQEFYNIWQRGHGKMEYQIVRNIKKIFNKLNLQRGK